MNAFMGVSSLGFLLLSLASAQAGEPMPAEPTALNAVIVTAERRPEAAGRTPISVVAYDARTVERRGLHSIDDIARLTPGVDFTRTGFGAVNRIAIRGLSSRIGAATTALYLDDAPIMVRSLGFTAANTYPSTFDLDRLEVLRGPQGTLFGAGAIGGAIRFITPQPGLDHWSGKARAELAGVAHGAANHEAGLVLDGPLAQDRVGLRLTLWSRRDGGYVDHVDRQTGALVQADANRLDTHMVRVALALKPSEKLTITPSLMVQERRLRDNDAFWEAFSDPAAGRFANAAQVSQPERDRMALSALKIDYDLGAARLTADSSLFWRGEKQRIDYSTAIPATFGPPVVAGLPGYVAWTDAANKQNSFSQELRLQSKPGGRLNWLVGGFYGNARQRARQLLIDPQADALSRAAFLGRPFAAVTGQPLIGGLYSYRSDDTAYDRQIAGFGEVRYELVPRLTMTGGLRVSGTRFRFASERAGGYASGGQAGAGSQTETPVTPRVSLAYAPDGASLLYVSAAKGYRIGGGNLSLPSRCGADLAALGLSAPPPAYDSDSVWSYEAGAKAGLLGGRLQLQSSVFHIDWSDVQQSVILPGCGLSFTTNAGRARSQGFDFQAEGNFGPLAVTLAVGYADARFRDTVLGGLAGPAGQRALIVKARDSLGNRPWSAAVAAEYSFTGPYGRPAYLRLDYQHLGADGRRSPTQDPLTAVYDPGLPNPSAANQLGLRAGLRLTRVELTLFAENLTDATPRLSRVHDSRQSNFYAQSTFRPRTLGVNANYSF
jgi:outer membrane receptor protein involved in Fe transport